jgi:uncharacterized protein YukE
MRNMLEEAENKAKILTSRALSAKSALREVKQGRKKLRQSWQRLRQSMQRLMRRPAIPEFNCSD